MVFRATGPGKIEIDPEYSSAGVVKALLYNFDFDDFAEYKWRDLKIEHTNFLVDKVIPLLANDSGNIWMQGSASRIGTNKWNMQLSDSRVTNVGNFLYGRGIQFEQMQMKAVGEELAGGHSEDDPRDRSVLLWVHPKEKHDPPPKPKVPSRPLASRYFKITMITGLSVSQALNVGKIFRGAKLGGGLAVDGIFFMVWDYRNHISCLYVYIGLGLGAGVSFTPKVSATTHGPWTAFTTEKPMSCWQFGRWARFTSAGAFSSSVNWITLETPKGIDNVSSLAIDTGTTLGAGMSSTVGDFIRVDQPHRYFGP
jgi:hypothetical protein